MKKRINLQKIVTLAVFFLVIYFIYKYQDTAGFQKAMKFLFNPDDSLAPPKYWQENRIVIIGGVTAALILYYWPVWITFGKVIHIFRDTPAVGNEPSLPALQAGYLYQQKQAGCLATWLIMLCSQGILALRYQPGQRPWSIVKGQDGDQLHPDNELAETLFKDGDTVQLKAVLSEPNRLLKEVSAKLFKKIAADSRHLLQPKRSSFPAWILFFLLLAEIPFYTAGQSAEIPGLIVAALFSAALSAFSAYAFCYALPAFFNGPRIVGAIILGAAMAISIFGHGILLMGTNFAAHWRVLPYPDLAVIVAVLVYNSPRLPLDIPLFQNIVGYKKYLDGTSYLIREKDLPWTIGLGVHADIVGQFNYGESSLPSWIITDDTHVRTVMKNLHQTFEKHVSEAIHGEMKSKSRLGSGRDKGRF